MFNIQFHL